MKLVFGHLPQNGGKSIRNNSNSSPQNSPKAVKKSESLKIRLKKMIVKLFN